MKKKIIVSIVLIGGLCSLLFAQRLTETPAELQTLVDAIPLKVAIDYTGDTTLEGDFTIEEVGATTNYLTQAFTNNVGGFTAGLLLTTKVHDGVTTTFYSFTD